MLTLTLAAILTMGLKITHQSVEEGSLVGSSLFVSFSYWLGASALFHAIGYFCVCRLRVLSVVSITGYSLFSYCVALLLATFLPSLFYLAWIIFGGGGGACLALAFYKNTADPQKGFISGAGVAAIHMLFLVYLRGSYASFYTAVADAI